mgnify:CR=1 FL=1
MEKETSKLKAEDGNLEELRKKLFEAAAADKLDSVKEVLQDIKESGVALKDKKMQNPENNANVLHHALDSFANSVANFLIENQDEEFVTQTYEVIVRKIPTYKTCLHQLSETGNMDLIVKLIDKIQNDVRTEYLNKTVLTEVPGQRPRHLSAIHIACLKGNTAVLEYLVHLGMDPNMVNNKQDTPVLWAARGNHLDTVRKLIQFGADLNHQNDKGSTPLYWAVRYGFVEMTELLLKEGKADVHQQRKLGLVSPIALAAAMGFTEIAEKLLDAGADINLKITSGYTPLHHAAAFGNVDTVELLIKRGANINMDNDAGDSPILLAAKENQMEVMEVLAAYGADLEDRNKDGKCMWDYAVESSDSDLLIAVAKCYRLANKIADNKLLLPKGKTPLHIAAISGDCDKLKDLIKMGGDSSAIDEGGNTFFHVAAREDQKEVIEEFMGKVSFGCSISKHLISFTLLYR